ncbi:DUF2264 domain-containing protein [Rhizomicrobium electricum]|uniref:DUF2264 domain-containing protein n=1 Tax=Rhizomicrobium electricum TaxID=480070 RepID=A0ABP3PRC0_9PROT|nr:DUF2264 domain-containing protein [Rhizomicrobium electricum]NIJ49089.1 hypothetical protein [Rhizomicrobium electricum]
MERRAFLKAMTAAAAAVPAMAARSDAETGPAASPADERRYWLDLLLKIATPVLASMAKGELKKNMPVELSPIWDGRDRNVAYLECFGRLISGLSPWLTLPEDDSWEGRERRRLREWALQSYAHSVDPKSPDYLLWRKEGQPLVDSAYFSNALIRAPKQLWEPLDKKTKARIVTELKLLRRVAPPYQNWILFAAMNEAFLASIGEEFDPMRIALAVRKINEWYVGDGWYGDGTRFHLDYYNSYVIHPMLVEILEVLVKTNTFVNLPSNKDALDLAMKRMQRYGECLERMISPDGAFSPIGRSATYRTAVFQPLALLAWRNALPSVLSKGRVRSALTAVHKRIFANPSNFTPDGFLTIGFAGHRPEIADIYSNAGSMYITTESLLPLALAAGDSFWTTPAEDWTAKRAFGGQVFERDHAAEF